MTNTKTKIQVNCMAKNNEKKTVQNSCVNTQNSGKAVCTRI
jgi:hypothetical protein